MSDSVCEWVHHEFGDVEKVISAETVNARAVQILETRMEILNTPFTASSL